MTKYKKQFRLFDVYRQWYIGDASKIYGIITYYINGSQTTLTVFFEDKTSIHYPIGDEKLLKAAITKINKKLNNCHKPGKRSKKNVTQ